MIIVFYFVIRRKVMKRQLIRVFTIVSLVLLFSAGYSAKKSTAPAQGVSGEVKVILSSIAGERLADKGTLPFIAEDNSKIPAITIDPSDTYQTIAGFGGAFTESAAYVLSKMTPDKRDEILKAYFSPQGSAYTLCRTHIGSCDFSLSSYSYDDVPADTNMTKFSIKHDKTWLIPLIKDAMAVPGASFKMLASPWSPPGWMKEYGTMIGGSKLILSFYPAWALYLSKYFQAYAQEGINFEYMTVQNEPWNDGRWEGCFFFPEKEADFVANNLGPQFEKDGIKTKILIYDHNKGGTSDYVSKVMANKKAAKYVWGAGVHWYGGDEIESVLLSHLTFPKVHIIATEACQEGGPYIGDWGVGERYSHDILLDLNNWVEGWIDWNIVLDETGGPNHATNFCSAPILCDTVSNNIIYNPSYYIMAHYSKFMRPGAVKIGAESENTYLEATAVKNPDGTFAVVVLNRTEFPLAFKLKIGNRIVKPNSPARSILTLVFK